MDALKFTDTKSGNLRDIVTRSGNNDHAFIPHPLPGIWRMPEKLWPLVCKAQHYVGRLEQIKGVLDHPGLLLRPLQRREAIHSSMLEGTITTAEQLLLYEQELGQKDIGQEPKSSSEADNQEVYNYYEALRYGHNVIDQGGAIDEELILQLHKILMTGVRGKDKSPGAFRTEQVYVGSGRKFIPPPPDEVLNCINQFTAYLASDDDTFDPLVRAYVAHYQFEAIHPFDDGNGRVGRLLLALCVSRWCNLSKPWLYMSEYFDRHRKEYVSLLFQVSATGDWKEWIEFCLIGTLEQASDAIDRCNKLHLLKEQYHKNVKDLGNRMSKIVNLLFQYPVIRPTDVSEACECSYETARVDTAKLVGAGILHKIDNSYPQAYAAREILEIAYGDG